MGVCGRATIPAAAPRHQSQRTRRRLPLAADAVVDALAVASGQLAQTSAFLAARGAASAASATAAAAVLLLLLAGSEPCGQRHHARQRHDGRRRARPNHNNFWLLLLLLSGRLRVRRRRGQDARKEDSRVGLSLSQPQLVLVLVARPARGCPGPARRGLTA
jgi:hypothetical protein